MPKPAAKFDMPPTTDDDVYKRDGATYDTGAGIYYPENDPERVTKEREEAATKTASFPILPEVEEWFAKEIAACDNINNIQLAAMTINGVTISRKVSVEAQLLAYQLLKEKLEEKHREFAKYSKELE